MLKDIARQKIAEEFKDINRNPMANIGFSVGLPNESNVFEWRCTLMGPSDSPYKNGFFSPTIILQESLK